MDKEHILAEIVRTAENNGGEPLGRSRFEAETGIRETDWSGRYWARWSEAVREAGYQPNQLQQRFDDDAVLSQLIPEVRRLGHLPTTSELRLRRREVSAFPSHGVFARLGSKQELAIKLADYCEERPEYADVLEIVTPLLRPATGGLAMDDGEAGEFGYVYLLKAGHHYKVGRTSSFERRERQLAIQLPERAETVHVISTDDPAGIESYWHHRFADRRKNGEWFELTSADVKAFRRRKFM